MKIERDVPLPETARTRKEELDKLDVGHSILLSPEEITAWRYPMKLSMADGERYLISRKGSDGNFRIWRKA